MTGTERFSSQAPKGPVLIEIGEDEGPRPPNPGDAPPVPDGLPDLPAGQVMQTVVALGGRRGSSLGKLFLGALGSFVTFAASIAA